MSVNRRLTDGFVSEAMQALARDLNGVLEGKITLSAPTEPEWIEHNLAGDSEEDSGRLKVLRAMPLELSVEAGTIPLTLEQLLDIEQGSIMELRLPEHHTVRLNLAGVEVCEAAVVKDGERLFVEIKKIFSKSEDVELDESGR